MKLRCAVACAAALVACGGGSSSDLASIPSAPQSDSRRPPGSSAGELQITFLAPGNAAVLAAAMAPEVRVRVVSVRAGTDQPSGDLLNPASVGYSLQPLVGSARTGKLVATMTPSEYSGRLDLAGTSTGLHRLTVSATTVAGVRGVATIDVQVDAGPRITIISPLEGSSHRASLLIQVRVDAGAFEPLMGGVDATIGGTPIALRPGIPNVYETVLELGRFMPPLEGEQLLRVMARNANGTRAESSARFRVDNQGPAFTMALPAPGAVVGGPVELKVKVDDPAGVVSSSVVAVVGNKTTVNFRVELQPLGDGLYAYAFDTRRLTSCSRSPTDPTPCIVYPNLSFRAADGLGNESELSYDFAVDNKPPVLELDPAPIRTLKLDGVLRRNVCSHAFDPVGDYLFPGDMPNDLCAVPQIFDMRAWIEDDGNDADGLKDIPIAEVDPRSPEVFVLDDTTQPLVVDGDGDGVCDDVNPRLVPTTTPVTQGNQVLAVRLAPVAPRGAPNYTPDETLVNPGPGWTACAPGRREELAPQWLCASQQDRMSLVIGWPNARGPNPSIWAVEPIGAVAAPWCAGSQIDMLANEIGDGWACIAARARDRAGNVSVSPPLRVWVQRRGLAQGVAGRCPMPPANAGPPPDCTGSHDRQTGVVTARACRTTRFRETLRYDFTGL